MIKLIATDVDGTLCRISTPKIHEGYYAAVRTLLDKGVKFVAASGRQYPAPVSYTHLDVYKRQLQNLVPIEKYYLSVPERKDCRKVLNERSYEIDK